MCNFFYLSDDFNMYLISKIYYLYKKREYIFNILLLYFIITPNSS